MILLTIRNESLNDFERGDAYCVLNFQLCTEAGQLSTPGSSGEFGLVDSLKHSDVRQELSSVTFVHCLVRLPEAMGMAPELTDE